MESDKVKKVQKTNPRAQANPLSVVTSSWTIPIFYEGMKRDLTIDDLTEPLKEHRSSKLGLRLEEEWEAEMTKSKNMNKEPSLTWVIFRIFGMRILLYGLALTTSQGLLILQPLLLGGLISYFTPGSKLEKSEAYMYAAGVILCSGAQILLEHPFTVAMQHIGMKVRVAMCSLMYRKALRLNKMALGQTTVGQVVNLMSNDVTRFDYVFQFIHMLWIGPTQTCIMTYLIWRMVGPASLIGVAALLLFIPFQGWLGKKASSIRVRTAGKTDQRVHLMNEIINGIQVIKMYTWENPFIKLVANARRKEIQQVVKSSYIKAVLMSAMVFHTRTAIFFTISSYVLLGHDITAEKVFVITSFYSVLRQAMTLFFPTAINQLAECTGSIKRITAFLVLDENCDQSLNFKNEKPAQNGKSVPTYDHIKNNVVKPGIFVENATAKWTPDSTEDTLSSISLKVLPGQLTVFVGTVGSGKTSFFHALLKELLLSSGSIKIHGKISYASQEPWLFQGSVRQNILFGQPYDKERYQKVVKVCALVTDFDQFPYGDKTIVGERGISLSGGQRARVNLARAVYQNADIYLLDDPLSAVDTHVGKHLFEDCIQGYLREKTVILITHQLQFLEYVDQIVLLENGKIVSKGTYKELKNSGLDFAKLMSEWTSEMEDEKNSKNVKRMISRRQSSVQSEAPSVQEDSKEPDEIAEHQTTGSIKGAVYLAYLKLCGGICYVSFILFMFVFSQVLASGSDYWLTYWVNLEEHVYKANKTDSAANDYPFIASREVCIYVFFALTFATIFVTLTRAFMFFNMCMSASKKLHNKMFQGIIRAPMLFFNVNPSGRILNRFSKDMGQIDELLPYTLLDVLTIGITLIAILVVVATVNPWLLIPTVLFGIVFYYLRIVYVHTSRSIKRLEGISRSPVYSHLNASLQGLATIRSFNAQDILIREFDSHQDLNNSAWFLFIVTSRVFGYWLDLICLLYIALVTLSFLVLGGETFGANVGLAITQSIGLTGMFQWGMKQTAELENQMTSVERILEYANLESEPPLESPPDKKPGKSWPSKGKVEFSKLSLRYSPNEPFVLKNLCFLIQPEEKVGIVGRTGAGKSSLIGALFRLNYNEGVISIDGIDVGPLGLHDLRSKISIIPQEPVLFTGTLRKNLDPFDEHNDEALWSALDEVELREAVKELANGLNGQITERGSNLSVGQRQLVCLARAIIKNNKILVLDEATANVDPKTDSLIQETIRSKFRSCTVLTIAHRLNTVMDSDKVLVMDGGYMVEFDHPYVLLQNPEGYFFKMVQQTGRNTEEALHRIAAENYKAKYVT